MEPQSSEIKNNIVERPSISGARADEDLQHMEKLGVNPAVKQKVEEVNWGITHSVDLIVANTAEGPKENRQEIVLSLLTGVDYLFRNPYGLESLVSDHHVTPDDSARLANFLRTIQKSIGSVNPDGSVTLANDLFDPNHRGDTITVPAPTRT